MKRFIILILISLLYASETFAIPQQDKVLGQLWLDRAPQNGVLDDVNESWLPHLQIELWHIRQADGSAVREVAFRTGRDTASAAGGLTGNQYSFHIQRGELYELRFVDIAHDLISEKQEYAFFPTVRRASGSRSLDSHIFSKMEMKDGHMNPVFVSEPFMTTDNYPASNIKGSQTIAVNAGFYRPHSDCAQVWPDKQKGIPMSATVTRPCSKSSQLAEADRLWVEISRPMPFSQKSGADIFINLFNKHNQNERYPTEITTIAAASDVPINEDPGQPFGRTESTEMIPRPGKSFLSEDGTFGPARMRLVICDPENRHCNLQAYIPAPCTATTADEYADDPTEEASEKIKTLRSSEKEEEPAFELFPNPADTRFYLRAKQSNTAIRQLEILNALGNSVYRKQNIANFPIEFSVPDMQLLNGLYYMRILEESGKTQVLPFEVIRGDFRLD